jgi:hypothetical protein
MISVHIVAYLLVVIAFYSYFIKADSEKAFIVTSICELITMTFSSLMLAWVVYNLSKNTKVIAVF